MLEEAGIQESKEIGQGRGVAKECKRLREVKLVHILDWRLAWIFNRKLAGSDLSGVWGK